MSPSERSGAGPDTDLEPSTDTVITVSSSVTDSVTDSDSVTDTDSVTDSVTDLVTVTDSDSVADSRLLLLVVLSAAALFAVAWPYTVDDAFLVARYARRLADGLGWTFVDGSATDGVTGPAWVLPGVLAELVGAPAWMWQKLVGAMLSLAAVAFVVRRARAPLVVGSVLLAQGSFVAWGVAGLETGAAAFAATVAALTRQPHARGIAIASLAWLRPELAVFALVLLVARPTRVAWVWAVLGAASVLMFRLATFGDVLPLAYHAKSGAIADGLSYAFFGVVFTTGLGGAWLAARSGRRAYLVAVVAHVIAVAVAGGDWMPGWRLLVPVLPLYAWLVGEGWALGSTRSEDDRVAAGPRSRWAWVACGSAVVGPVILLALQVSPWRESGRAREQSTPLVARIAATRSIALVDVGWLVWASDVDVLDLGGLTDPTIARAPGGHLRKQIDVAYLAARDPEVILLHAEAPPELDEHGNLVRLAGFPVERFVAAHPWTREHYGVRDVISYREGYVYVWLERRPP